MHCHDSLSVWWSDYFLALIRGGPQRWVSYDLYGVERGERASVFGIHVVSAMPLPICSSQCKLSFPVRSNSSAPGHLVSEGFDWKLVFSQPRVPTRYSDSLGFLIHPFGGPTVPVAMVVDPATFKTLIVGARLVVLVLRERSRWPLSSSSSPSSGVSLAP